MCGRDGEDIERASDIRDGCFQIGEWDEVSTLKQGALARFRESNDFRVALKMQNTERFLEAAQEHSHCWYAKYRPRKSQR
ncbi:MAG: hypothetical protein QM784_36985 [Polyangiaceae bacterium]